MSKKKIVIAIIICLLFVGVFFLIYNSCTEDSEHEHDWDNGVVVKKSTTTTYGTIVYTCNICLETKSQMLAKIPHDHVYSGEWLHNRMAHWHACDVENCTVLGDKGFHRWDEGVILEEANQNTAGKKRFTCETCGYEKEESYSVEATVTAQEWVSALSRDTFGNVTIEYENAINGETVYIEIAGGKVRYTDINGATVSSDSEGTQYSSYYISGLFRDIANLYEDFTYEGGTRAYICAIGENRYSVQFSNGKVTHAYIKTEQVAITMSFSAYNRTEISE